MVFQEFMIGSFLKISNLILIIQRLTDVNLLMKMIFSLWRALDLWVLIKNGSIHSTNDYYYYFIKIVCNFLSDHKVLSLKSNYGWVKSWVECLKMFFHVLLAVVIQQKYHKINTPMTHIDNIIKRDKIYLPVGYIKWK